MTSSATISFEPATAQDGDALRALAQLDSQRPIAGPALLAVVDGRLVAAIALHDARVIADPFAPTQETVRLLRLRAGLLRGGRDHGARRRPRLSLRPRAAV